MMENLFKKLAGMACAKYCRNFYITFGWQQKNKSYISDLNYDGEPGS